MHVVRPVSIDAMSSDNVVNAAEALVITGKADAGATVAVNINSQTFNVTADSNGNWSYDGTTVRYIMVRKDLKTTVYGEGRGDVQVNALWNLSLIHI